MQMAVINLESDILDLRTSRCAFGITHPSATHIISMATPGWMEENSNNGSIGVQGIYGLGNGALRDATTKENSNINWY
eukprot:IDg16788t1